MFGGNNNNNNSNSSGGSGQPSTTPAAPPPSKFTFSGSSFGKPSDSDNNSSSTTPFSKPPATSGFSFGTTSNSSSTPATFSFGSTNNNNSSDASKNTSLPTFGSSGGTGGSTSGFTFGSSLKPSTSTFSFGSAANKDSSTGTNIPASSSSENKPPTFGGFGSSTSNAFSFGKPQEKKDETPKASSPSSFSFGSLGGLGKPATDSATNNQNKVENSQQSTPTFSFGQSKPVETNNTASTTTSSTPSFSFGQSKPLGDTQSKPAFSFGNSSTPSAFGKPTDSKSLSSSTPSSAPTSAPAFSFSAPSQSSTPTGGEQKDKHVAFSLTSSQSANQEKKADTTTSSTPSGGFSFGTPSSSGFSFNKPNDSSTPKPPQNTFSFGAPKDSSTTNLQNTAPTKPSENTAPSAFSFAAPTKPSSDTTATKEPTKGGFSFQTKSSDDSAKKGGFSFGNPVQPTAEKSEKPTTSGGFSFTTPSAVSTDKAAVNPSTDTEGSKTSGFSFSAPKSTSDNKDSSSTTAPSFPSTAPKTDDKVTAPPTKIEAPSAQQTLKTRTVDDIITKWTTDLEVYSQKFQDQAKQIAIWDKTLLENGDRITKLYAETIDAENTQGKLNQALNYIESQQDEIDGFLSFFEQRLDETLANTPKQPPEVEAADNERERVYRKGEELNLDLSNISTELESIITQVNKISDNDGNGVPDDPYNKVIKILGSQISSLQWIDTTTESLRKQLQETEMETRRKFNDLEDDNDYTSPKAFFTSRQLR